MPSLRPCTFDGCRNLVRGTSRCPTHSWRGNWPRSSREERGYGQEWRTIRAQVLEEERACRVCGSTKRLEVDHITPKSKGGTNARSNLQVLCHDHHWAKTKAQSPRMWG